MVVFIDAPRGWRFAANLFRMVTIPCCALLAVPYSLAALGKEPTPPLQPVQMNAAQQSAAPASPAQSLAPATAGSESIIEEQLKQLFAGKTLYLRGGYMDEALSFDQYGRLTGNSPRGSFTLSLVRIDKVRMNKHKVEFEGVRYALHFLGALPYDDPTKAVDKVRITPKKKVVKITVDREQVVKLKKTKEKSKPTAARPAQIASAGSSASQPGSTIEPHEAGVETAAAPENRASADEMNGTTTSSEHAARLLKQALDQVFAPEIDNRMIASMPDFWKLYYQAAAAKTDYKPGDPGVFLQGAVDQKAKLLSTLEPPSNEYAQANEIAGIAMYHAVIAPDGKPVEIVAFRPIGFGLDESAVETIRKANFQPAIKDGKPVPVWLDMVVQFRIFSKRTLGTGAQEATGKAPNSTLPGPYSVQHR